MYRFQCRSNEQTSHHRLIHVQGLSSAPSNSPKLSVTDEHPAHESGGSPPGSTPGGTATSAARARSESRARSSQFSEYDVAEVRDYFRWRHFTVALRMATIVTEILILRLLQYTQPDIQKRAAKVRGPQSREHLGIIQLTMPYTHLSHTNGVDIIFQCFRGEANGEEVMA